MKILEASPGFGRPLNEQVSKNFKTAGKLNKTFGTVDEKGDANIHPAWSCKNIPTNKMGIETSKQTARKRIILEIKRMFTFVSMNRIFCV